MERMKDSEEVEVAVEQDVRVVQGKRGFINIRIGPLRETLIGMTKRNQTYKAH